MIRDRSFWLICAVGFLAFVSYDLIRSPLLPLFAEELGAGPESVGLIVGASTLTGILVKFPAGILSDHVGRSRMLLLGLLVFAAAPLAYGFLDRLWPLLILRFFHGLATGIFAPVGMAVVVDLFRERRGEALGWYSSFCQAGRLFGRMAGGYLLMSVHFGPTFLISGGAGLAALVLFTRLKLDPVNSVPARPGKSASIGEMWKGLGEVASDARILVTSAMEAGQMLAGGALMAFLPLYGTLVGLDAGRIGLLFGVQGISSILAKPVMGRVSDRFGRRRWIVAGQLVCAAVIALVPWTTDFASLLVLSFAFGFGEAVIGSSTSALVADLSADRRFGSAMGVFGTIMDAGHASGPILTGLLIGWFGYRGAFGLVGGLLVLMVFPFLWVVRRPVSFPAG